MSGRAILADGIRVAHDEQSRPAELVRDGASGELSEWIKGFRRKQKESISKNETMSELLGRMNLKPPEYKYAPRGPRRPKGADGLKDIPVIHYGIDRPFHCVSLSTIAAKLRTEKTRAQYESLKAMIADFHDGRESLTMDELLDDAEEQILLAARTMRKQKKKKVL